MVVPAENITRAAELLKKIIFDGQFEESRFLKEREVVLGLYKDDKTGEFLFRHTDDNGNFIEDENDYLKLMLS
jgi:hypothetical protein